MLIILEGKVSKESSVFLSRWFDQALAGKGDENTLSSSTQMAFPLEFVSILVSHAPRDTLF